MDWSGCQVLDGGQLNPTENFQIITAGTNIKFRSKLTGFVIDPNKVNNNFVLKTGRTDLKFNPCVTDRFICDSWLLKYSDRPHFTNMISMQ